MIRTSRAVPPAVTLVAVTVPPAAIVTAPSVVVTLVSVTPSVSVRKMADPAPVVLALVTVVTLVRSGFATVPTAPADEIVNPFAAISTPAALVVTPPVPTFDSVAFPVVVSPPAEKFTVPAASTAKFPAPTLSTVESKFTVDVEFELTVTFALNAEPIDVRLIVSVPFVELIVSDVVGCEKTTLSPSVLSSCDCAPDAVSEIVSFAPVNVNTRFAASRLSTIGSSPV